MISSASSPPAPMLTPFLHRHTYHVLSFCLFLILVPSTFAFQFHAPAFTCGHAHNMHHHRRRRRCRHLQSSSMDDPSTITSIINVAYISNESTNDDGDKDNNCFNEMTRLLATNSFSKMTGVQLTLSTLPIATASSSSSSSLPTFSWADENLSLLQRADIVCFKDHSDVQSYLDTLDEHLGIPKDMKVKERKKLPNKPTDDDNTITMAACPNFKTARECLKSGRWMSNHIYYPKNKEQGEADNTIHLEAWVNSVAQAAGDVMERKFWGGGW